MNIVDRTQIEGLFDEKVSSIEMAIDDATYNSVLKKFRQFFYAEFHGKEEQWDFFIYEYDEDGLVSIVINNRNILRKGLASRIRELINEHGGLWVFKVEVYDNIVNDSMIAGDDIAEILITNDEIFAWLSPMITTSEI